MINVMKAAIQNSLLARILTCISVRIMSIISRLRGWYHFGVLDSFFQCTKGVYRNSRLRRLWDKVCTGKVGNEDSAYFRLIVSLRRLLERIGDIILQSTIYNVCRRGCIRIREKFTGSIVCRPLLRAYNFLGVRGTLLVILGLYLPLDVLIRARLPAAIGSIWDECLMLVALAYVMWHTAAKRAPIGSRATNLDVFLILFIGGGVFLMCAVSPSMPIAVAGYRAVVEYLFWFFLVIRLIEDDRDFMVFYGTLVVLGILLGLHGIYQFIVAAPIPSNWVSQAEQSIRTRVYSITGSPNIMGSLMVLLAPMVAGVAYYSKKLSTKVLAICATGVLCLSCVFTFSKGAWGGLVVAVVVFGMFIDRRLIALMGAVGAGVFVMIPSVAHRITFLFTADYAAASRRAGRSVRWEIGLNLLHDSNPWLGFGLGRYGGAVAMQNQVLKSDEFTYYYMDNYYLKTMVEMGYIGFILFLLLLLALAVLCLRSIRHSPIEGDNPTRILAVAMFSGMMGVLAHCIFENIFEVPYMTAYFWSMAAAIIYVGYFRKQGAPLKRSPQSVSLKQ